MTRYAMFARSQGKMYTQRAIARLAPEVECAVRKWLLQRLDGFHCDLQAMYVPLVRHSPARTHIVLNNASPLSSPLLPDEAVSVDGSGLNAREAAVKATGLNPHMSVCGWPFCLGDLDDTGGVR